MPINVNHHGVEFGYELGAVIPYAYWLHQRGELGETHSCKDTAGLYFFSENHIEDIPNRHSRHVLTCRKEGLIPNIKLHVTNWDYSRWSPPNYTSYYANNDFDYDVVITNKYNMEWKSSPINFIDHNTLDKLFDLLSDYKVLYNHMTSNMGYDDTVASMELGEWGVVEKHNVDTIQSILKEHPYNYNEIQLRIYPNVKLFITLQGGSSILASYFGGTNIIYAKKGQEIKFGSYKKWYPKLGGSKIVHVTYQEDIIKQVKLWLENMI